MYIPDTENNLNEVGILTYLNWKKEFDSNVSIALEKIREITTLEKKYAEDFKRHMSKFNILRESIGN